MEFHLFRSSSSTIRSRAQDFVKQEARVDSLHRELRDYNSRLESSKEELSRTADERDKLLEEVGFLQKRIDQQSPVEMLAKLEMENERMAQALVEANVQVSSLQDELDTTVRRQEELQGEISTLSASLSECVRERGELARSVLILHRLDLLPFHMYLDEDIDHLRAYLQSLDGRSFDSRSLFDFIIDLLNGLSSVVSAGLDGRVSIQNNLARPPVAWNYASLFSSETGPSAFDIAGQEGTMLRPDLHHLAYPTFDPEPSPSPVTSVVNWENLNTMLYDPGFRASSAPPELPIIIESFDDASMFTDDLSESSGEI